MEAAATILEKGTQWNKRKIWKQQTGNGEKRNDDDRVGYRG